MGHGHLIPIMDMAKLFAARGVKATIVTTPRNVPLFSKIHRINIDIQIIKFMAIKAALPEGCENIDLVTSLEMAHKFIKATKMLQQPLEQLLREYQPSCLVVDMFFPWATDVATKFGILSLVFEGTSFFSMVVAHAIGLYEPHKKFLFDFETFVIPNFPGEIKLTRKQLPDTIQPKVDTNFIKLLKEAKESELISYGVVVNSFYELESAYADHFRKVMGRNAWHIGPEASIDENECLKWLSTKKPNLVIYICFGSRANFIDSQLFEIVMGIEALKQQFIWVVRKGKNEKEEEDWLPKGFEKRIVGKGLIIRGWAPQVLFLDRAVVGGFVTHCRWNSTLEGVSVGVPMVPWPMGAELFYNENLVIQVLKIGISVCAKQWTRVAMRQILVGEEVAKARALEEMARRAVEEGGSSYFDLNALIEELSGR
ncbi:hypothetical protein ACJW31_07G102600 [Castanea mollissima]